MQRKNDFEYEILELEEATPASQNEPVTISENSIEVYESSCEVETRKPKKRESRMDIFFKKYQTQITFAKIITYSIVNLLVTIFLLVSLYVSELELFFFICLVGGLGDLLCLVASFFFLHWEGVVSFVVGLVVSCSLKLSLVIYYAVMFCRKDSGIQYLLEKKLISNGEIETEYVYATFFILLTNQMLVYIGGWFVVNLMHWVLKCDLTIILSCYVEFLAISVVIALWATSLLYTWVSILIITCLSLCVVLPKLLVYRVNGLIKPFCCLVCALFACNLVLSEFFFLINNPTIVNGTFFGSEYHFIPKLPENLRDVLLKMYFNYGNTVTKLSEVE